MSLTPKEPTIKDNRQISKKWFQIFKNIFAIIVLFGFGYYLWEHKDELYKSLDVSLWHLVSIILLIFISWFLGGIQATVTYRVSNINISVMEGIMLTLAGSFGNHLPMRVGTIIRANYLKEIHGLRYAHFGGIMGIRTLLTILATGISGIIGLLIISFTSYQSIPWDIVLFFLLLTFAPMLLLVFTIPKFDHNQGVLLKFVAGFANSFEELKQKPQVCTFIVILLLIQYIVLALRFIVAADSVGIDIPIGLLFLMAPLAALMSYTALTPGGIGLREMLMGYISFKLGYTFALGTFIGAIDRAVLLVMMAIFGGWSFLVVWLRCRK